MLAQSDSFTTEEKQAAEDRLEKMNLEPNEKRKSVYCALHRLKPKDSNLRITKKMLAHFEKEEIFQVEEVEAPYYLVPKENLDLRKVQPFVNEIKESSYQLEHYQSSSIDTDKYLIVDCEVERSHLGPHVLICLLYTSPSPRDATLSRMPSSA